MNTLIVAILVILVLYIVIWFKRQLRFRRLLNQFPGRQCNPIVGDVLNFSLQQDVLFQQVREIVEEFPDGFRGYGGPYGGFVFTRHEDIEVVLSSSRHLQKSIIYEGLQVWLGTGLLTSADKKWAERRKVLTPAFHFSILRRFVRVFSAHSETFIEELRGECAKSQTDVVPLISSLALNIICETAMGINGNSCKEKFIEYQKAVHGLGNIIVNRVFRPWLYSHIIYFFTSYRRLQGKYVKTLHQFSTEVIKARESTFNESDLENITSDDEDDAAMYSKHRFAMLDLLLLAKKHGQIDDEGIREEVDTFMFEGHDTVSMALSFCLFALANHKHVQEKCRAEVDKIFNGSTRPANYQDLQSMHYLEMVIKESLRLYPSVPLIIRNINEDVPFRNGKYTMPKGAQVILFIYYLHRNPAIFPDPEKFDPDRFLPENVKGRHPYAYIPFSAGPRNCIGQKFALLEMKCVLSSILRHYEIEPIDTKETLTLIIDIVLRPKNGIHVKFKPRSGINNLNK